MARFSSLACLAALAASLSLTGPASGQSDEATALTNRALDLHEAGKTADALPLAERALQLREKALPAGHPDIGRSLNYLGMLYQAQGRLPEAERLLKRALDQRQKSLPPDHADVAVSLNNLAALYQAQGRWTEAEPLYKRALDINSKALPAEHTSIAMNANNLAELYRAQGRLSEAEPLYQRALAILERALRSGHPAIARVSGSLGLLHVGQGRFVDAEPLLRRAVTIYEKALPADHPDLALSLSNLAGFYEAQGRLAEAEPLFKRALAILEKALPAGHPDIARSLNNLAGILRVQARFQEAEALQQRALEIWQRTLPADHPDIARSLNNLALIVEAQGRLAEAETLFRRVVETWQKVLPAGHPDIALSLNNLAGLLLAQGRFAEAEPLLRRALQLREAALPAGHPDIAVGLNNLAENYAGQRRLADAEPLYKRALAIYETALPAGHPNVAIAQNNLASVLGFQGRDAEALPIVRATMSQNTAARWAALPVLFGAQARGAIPVRDALDDSLNIVQRAAQTSAAEALNALAVRFSAGSDRLAQLVRKDQDLTVEAAGLDKAILETVAKEPSKRDAGAEQKIRDRIAAIATERRDVQQVFAQEFPDYAALSQPQPMNVGEIQRLLADDEALVVFDFGDTSYGWILTKSDADWAELTISAQDLEAQVKALRASISGAERADRGYQDISSASSPTASPFAFDHRLAYQIYRATFGTFAAKIAAKARLSVVANGGLTSLPPQLLVTRDPAGKRGKDVDWLVRSHAITVLPSVASLKVLRGRSVTSSARRPMVAFADPVFSNDQKSRAVALRPLASLFRGGRVDRASLAGALPRLPETADEVLEIARVLQADRSDLRLGTAASVTNVKRSRLDQYRIVYFATHGLVAGEVATFAKLKAEPALALSIPEQPTDFDNGLLTASEVAQLKLDADWVVLSACNTAAEDKPGAEALSGLARAFFYAGGRSLLVSHWAVDSKATVRLMVGTFLASARNPKLSHAEALRQSMLAMIDAAKSDYDAHPRFWAPFVVVGEPANPR